MENDALRNERLELVYRQHAIPCQAIQQTSAEAQTSRPLESTSNFPLSISLCQVQSNKMTTKTETNLFRHPVFQLFQMPLARGAFASSRAPPEAVQRPDPRLLGHLAGGLRKLALGRTQGLATRSDLAAEVSMFWRSLNSTGQLTS